MKIKKYIRWWTILPTLLILLYVYLRLPPSPAAVMEDFYRPSRETGRKEGRVNNPLRANADIVKYLVIESIPNKNMVNRYEAISFLGNCRIQEGIAALLSILYNENEDKSYRWYALKNIFYIDESLGYYLAEIHKSREDIIGDTAREILNGEIVWSYPDSLYSDEFIAICSNLE